MAVKASRSALALALLTIATALPAPTAQADVEPLIIEPVQFPLATRIGFLRTPGAIVIPSETIPANLVHPTGSVVNVDALVDVDVATLYTGLVPATRPEWPPLPAAASPGDSFGPPQDERPPRAAASRELALPALPELPSLPALPSLPELLPAPPVPLQLGDPLPLDPAWVLWGADAATYGACAASASGTVCSSFEVPFGAPILLDVDRDPATGVGGMDVSVHLAPILSPETLGQAPGLSVALRIDVLPGPLDLASSGGALLRELRAKVWATYSIVPPGGTSGYEIRAGVDGSRAGTRLPMTSNVVLTLTDPAALLDGELLARAEATFDASGPDATLFGAWRKIAAGAPLSEVRVTTTPASALDLDVAARLDGSEASATAHIALRPVLNVSFGTLRADGSSTAVWARMSAAPTSLTVGYQRVTDGILVTYDAEQTVPLFTLDHADVDGAGMGTFGHIDVTNLPREIDLTLRPRDGAGSLSYRANTAIERVAGTYVAKKPTGTTVASATLSDVPTALDVAWSTGATSVVTTAAPRAWGPATFALSMGAGRPAFAGTIASLPPALATRFGAGFAEVDAGSASIGTIVASYASKGNLLPAQAPGDHLVYEGSGSEVRVHVAHTGLKLLRFDDRGPRARIDVQSAAPRVHWFRLALPDGTIDGTIDAVPSQLTLQLDDKSLSYAANAAIAAIHARLVAPGLVGEIDVIGVPKTLEATWNANTGSVGFTASPAVGRIEGDIRMNGGVAPPVAMDHVVLVRSGAQTGLSFRVSGVSGAATIAPGAYSLDVAPGGQRFHAAATVDGLAATLDVTALPSHLEVALSDATSCYGHATAAPIGEVRATLARASTGLDAAVRLVGVPAEVDACWSLGAASTFTYAASGDLAEIHAFARASSAGAALDARVTDVPSALALAAGAGAVTFDAPGGIGTIAARVGSDGSLLTGTPAIAHAVLRQTPSATQASLLYAGLTHAALEPTASGMRAELTSLAGAPLLLGLDAPGVDASVRIEDVPASVEIELAPASFEIAGSAAIALVDADLEAANGAAAGALLAGVPASARLDLALATQTVAWNASAPIPSLTIVGRTPAGGASWSGRLALTGVPASWDASWGSALARFRGLSGPIGTVSALVTNHGLARTFPGNHLSLEALDGAIDASFAMSQVSLAQFAPLSNGFASDLRMGGGGGFFAHARALAGPNAANVDARIAALPTSVQLSQVADDLTYTANATFDLYALASLGNTAGISSAPVPPLVRGLSARDGYGCVATACAGAIRASVFLQGLPTALHVDARSSTFDMTGFQPPAGKQTLALDIDLDNPVSPTSNPARTRLLALQSGIPLGWNAVFGPIVVTRTSSGDTTSLSYGSNAALGSFMADAIQGAVSARVEVSHVPASLSFSITEGRAGSTASVAMSQGIPRIFVAARATVASGSFAGGVELEDVPSSLSVSVGRVSQTVEGSVFTLPGLSYSASAAGLDIDAWVDAELAGGDLKAKAMVGLKDLARVVTATVDSAGVLRMTSKECSHLLCPTSPSGIVELHVWGEYSAVESGGGCVNTSGGGSCTDLYLDYDWIANIQQISIEDLMLKVTDVRTLTLRFALTTSVEGAYGEFDFGVDRVQANVKFWGRVAVKERVCLFSCSTYTLGSFTASYDPPLQTIDFDFFEFSNTRDRAMCRWGLEIETRPSRMGGSVERVELTGSEAAANGGKFFFMPVPDGFLTDGDAATIAEIVAPYTVPAGATSQFVVSTC